MKTNLFRQNNAKWRLLPAVFLVAVFAAMAGCAMTPAYLKPSHEVTWAFEAYDFPAGYDYYYHGPKAKPTAMVGIRSDVPFDPGPYLSSEFSQGFIRNWVQGIKDPGKEKKEIFGRTLMMNKEPVGVWYSDWQAPPARILADGRLRLYPPAKLIPEKDFMDE